MMYDHDNRFDMSRPAPDLIRSLCDAKSEEVSEFASAIVGLLGHTAPEVRAEALSALFVTGRIIEHRSILVAALSRDGDEGVRAKAAYGIAATSSEDTFRYDVQLLVRALRNGYESSEVRRAVYEALLLLFHRPDFPDALDEFNADVQVDWDWIAEIEGHQGD